MAKTPRRLRLESLETRKLLAGLLGPDRMEDHQELVSKSTVPSVFAVTAENLEGLRSAEVHLNFEASELDVAAASVKAGAAWQGKASVISKVDEATGTLNVFVFSVNPIAIPEGELLAVEFDLVDELATDVSTQIALTKFELNEGAIESTAALLFEAEPAEALPAPDLLSESVDQAANMLPLAIVSPSEVIPHGPDTQPLAPPPAVLPQMAPELSPQDVVQVTPRIASRIQPRVLETPVLGPIQIQTAATQMFGYFFADTDWLADEFRVHGRRL